MKTVRVYCTDKRDVVLWTFQSEELIGSRNRKDYVSNPKNNIEMLIVESIIRMDNSIDLYVEKERVRKINQYKNYE